MMMKWKIFVPSLILLALMIIGFVNPVFAIDGDPLPPSVSKPVITAEKVPPIITPCTNFEVEFWIRGIPEGYHMYEFDFGVLWNTELIELVDFNELVTTKDKWTIIDLNIDPSNGYVFLHAVMVKPCWTEDAVWAIATFHCLGVGESTLTVTTINTIYLEGPSGGSFYTEPEPYEVICNQAYPGVGGIMTSVNKLIIIAPFIVGAGLAAGIGAIIFIRRRKI